MLTAESMSEHESPITTIVERAACCLKKLDDAEYAVAFVNDVIGGVGAIDDGTESAA
jgi:hypothetical protein